MIYTFAILFNFPRFFRGSFAWNKKQGKYIVIDAEFTKSWWYDIFYWVILNYFIILIIPTVILTFTTIRLIMSLRKIKSKKEEMKSSVTQKPRDDITLSLIAMVIAFVCLNFSAPLRRLVREFVGLQALTRCDSKYYELNNVDTVHIVHSSVCFICYILLSKKFRQRIQKLLFKKSNAVEPSTKSSTFGGTKISTIQSQSQQAKVPISK